MPFPRFGLHKTSSNTPPNAESIKTKRKPPPTPPTAAVTTHKPVFFHYMIGTITDPHCQQDVQDALSLGADAFALNVDTCTASWALNTVQSLFKWANAYAFKLFFSFDMTGFSHPEQFTDFLLSWVTDAAYYQFNGLPFVSTFNGGASQFTFGHGSVNEGWNVELKQVLAKAGHPIYFVPAFQDVVIADSFFSTFPSLDGAMNWNSWPFHAQAPAPVPTTHDRLLSHHAHSTSKPFMMGLSPLQFKHVSPAQNWYRAGHQNLEHRIPQVLALQPDFVQFQSWNDSGESHYMGNIWPEAIAGTPIVGYAMPYNHTGYWEVLPAVISAFQRGERRTVGMVPGDGKVAKGCFWHHTLLADAKCPSDPLGPPDGVATVEDRVTSIILIAANQTHLHAIVTSGSQTLGTHPLTTGYNAFSFPGMTTGIVAVRVVDGKGDTVIRGIGPMEVVSQAELYCYNFQVVGMA